MIAFTEATIASSGGQRLENESHIATDDLTMLSRYNVTEILKLQCYIVTLLLCYNVLDVILQLSQLRMRAILQHTRNSTGTGTGTVTSACIDTGTRYNGAKDVTNEG